MITNSDAIHKSLVESELSNDIISVFPNRFIVRTEETTKAIVYSIKYGATFNFKIKAKCKKYQMKYHYSALNGLICKTHYALGRRFSFKSGNLKLFLWSIADNGKIDGEVKCDV